MMWYVPTFQRVMLPPSSVTSPWKWRQHDPPKRWYLITSLHGVITQKTTTWISIQAPIASPWRRRQHDPPKRWYLITSLHADITQKNITWISIQTPLTSPWIWKQHDPPKWWYPLTSLYGVRTQKTTTSNSGKVNYLHTKLNRHRVTARYETSCASKGIMNEYR
jgi:hypothetical protein